MHPLKTMFIIILKMSVLSEKNRTQILSIKQNMKKEWNEL